jgi:hypothetical protein
MKKGLAHEASMFRVVAYHSTPPHQPVAKRWVAEKLRSTSAGKALSWQAYGITDGGAQDDASDFIVDTGWQRSPH